MNDYRILSFRRRDFRVLAPDGTTLGEVCFASWWNSSAEGRVGDRAFKAVPPAAFSRQPYRIELDGTAAGTVKFSWTGNCTIALEIAGRPWTFRFRMRGWSKGGFGLSTTEGIPVVDLITRWKWFGQPDYDLRFPSGATVPTDALPLLLCTCGYAAALFRARMAAAG